ncbi:peroxidase 12-like [Rutidosis leptorrhynchoides]|uniref:peroxidase 12-like n=1 Tax=Rutidosis leptorrhynchoides TaxID=125765 RepID=UPI003A99B920
MANKITLMPFHTLGVFVGVLMLMHLQGSEAQKQPLVNGLSWNFYENSCPKLESIIRKQMEKVIKKDISLAASLLRVHFHDCFVQGCDGSVLLDGSASGPVDSEKTAPPNLSLRGFDVIEDLRSRVHKQCGAGSVSCSDITSIVARDSIVLTGGPDYSVPLGRRDGLSFATRNATLANLPSPFVPTGTLLTNLAVKNFNATEAVALSGAHTIGVAHCTSFTTRLYPTQDTTLDQTFAKNLKGVCPTANTTATTTLDIRSPNVFDNKYFVDLMNKQGLLTSDQDLYTDKRTRDIVKSFAVNQTLFFEKFVDVMVKMGQMDVLTGTQGEVRNKCNLRNSNDLLISTVVNDDNMDNVESL